MVNTIFAKAVEESSINHASVLLLLLLLLLLKFASVFLLGGRSIFAYPLVAAGRASSHNWSGLPVKVLPQSRGVSDIKFRQQQRRSKHIFISKHYFN